MACTSGQRHSGAKVPGQGQGLQRPSVLVPQRATAPAVHPGQLAVPAQLRHSGCWWPPVPPPPVQARYPVRCPPPPPPAPCRLGGDLVVAVQQFGHQQLQQPGAAGGCVAPIRLHTASHCSTAGGDAVVVPGLAALPPGADDVSFPHTGQSQQLQTHEGGSFPASAGTIPSSPLPRQPVGPQEVRSEPLRIPPIRAAPDQAVCGRMSGLPADTAVFVPAVLPVLPIDLQQAEAPVWVGVLPLRFQVGDRVIAQGLRTVRMNGRHGTVVGVAAGVGKYEVQLVHGRVLTLGSPNLAASTYLAQSGAVAAGSSSAMRPFGRRPTWTTWTQPPLWQLFEPQDEGPPPGTVTGTAQDDQSPGGGSRPTSPGVAFSDGDCSDLSQEDVGSPGTDLDELLLQQAIASSIIDTKTLGCEGSGGSGAASSSHCGSEQVPCRTVGHIAPTATVPSPEAVLAVEHPILDRRLPLAQSFEFCAGAVLRTLCIRHGMSAKGGRVVLAQKLALFFAERGDEAEAVLTLGSLPLSQEENGQR